MKPLAIIQVYKEVVVPLTKSLQAAVKANIVLKRKKANILLKRKAVKQHHKPRGSGIISKTEVPYLWYLNWTTGKEILPSSPLEFTSKKGTNQFTQAVTLTLYQNTWRNCGVQYIRTDGTGIMVSEVKDPGDDRFFPARGYGLTQYNINSYIASNQQKRNCIKRQKGPVKPMHLCTPLIPPVLHLKQLLAVWTKKIQLIQLRRFYKLCSQTAPVNSSWRNCTWLW